MTPVYLRIAGDIRRQIERGELAVGDPVPSTREVARRWKVAMATAAHALQTLAREGVVRGVPRVGTIVASAQPKALARERDSDVTRTRTVACAIAIADAEGLAALSLRGVAAKVGVPVMSLYRHVRNKDELLRAMTDAALGEEMLPSPSPPGWRAKLEAGARAEWRIFRRHPWLARLVNITRPQSLPNALTYADFIFGALAETGADAATQMRLHVILHGFVQGIAVNVEAEAEAASESGMSDEEWMTKETVAFTTLAASGRYPHFANVLASIREDFAIDFDDLFERGLAAMLDGFEPLLERAAKSKRRRR